MIFICFDGFRPSSLLPLTPLLHELKFLRSKLESFKEKNKNFIHGLTNIESIVKGRTVLGSTPSPLDGLKP